MLHIRRCYVTGKGRVKMAAITMRVGAGSFASVRVYQPALRSAAVAALRAVSLSYMSCFFLGECGDVTLTIVVYICACVYVYVLF